MKYKKKLIEVALPLEAINAASASEKGNPEAQCHMGFCYLQGIGVEKDLPKAIHFFKLASEKGNEKAKEMLKNLLHC
jgi:TPR repeat protein